MLKDSQNLNDNLAKVTEIYENAPRAELLAMLQGGNALQRQISALKLDNIRSADEAQVFISNLTGQDGKIREAVSFRLKEFVAENPDFFAPHYDIFLQAILDINGNVCRNLISALQNLKNVPQFMSPFCAGLEKITSEIIKNIPAGSSGYKVNKEVFKLYWCLEAICEFCDCVPAQIVQDAAGVNDYTIREKLAKILTKVSPSNAPELMKLKQKLKNDPNYYVRRF